MKRFIIAVGCDKYDSLNPLSGAERDAADVHKLLVAPEGDYDAEDSRLLLSPTVAEITDALSKLPVGEGMIDSLTFFFAGHGVVKAGTFYLCCRDSDIDRMSTSALSVGRLLATIAELRPQQANLIIDACESGGAMFDSGALLREDALGIGSKASLSIAFLAACAPNEYAAESDNGGELTRALLPYILGYVTLQTTRPALDLIDLGRRVSAELSDKLPDQVPVSWGINLTGEGRFVPNPRFAPATEDLAKAAAVLSSGAIREATRKATQRHAYDLWTRHREAEEEVDVAALRQTLGALIADLGGDTTAIAQSLRGLGTSLRASSVKSTDVFAEATVLLVCAEPLLGYLQDPVAVEAASQLLVEARQALSKGRQWLLRELKSDRYCLLSDGNGIADLYYLPLRVSRILGFLGVELLVGRLIGGADAEAEVREVAELMLQHYAASMVPVSDEQAPHILAFIEAARLLGWKDIIDQIAGCYFNGFVESKGVIARVDLPPEDAFRFALQLGGGPERVDHRFRANPTQMATVLLLGGAISSMDNEWDPDLAVLDHHTGYVFVPKNYMDFSVSMIENGTNVGFMIGGDVFTIEDFRTFVQSAVRGTVETAKTDLSPLAAVLALVASCLQPDRLAFHILEIGPSLGLTAGVAASVKDVE